MEEFLPGVTSAPNLHPVVVHFPISFWLAGAAAWGWALLRTDEDVWRFGLWLQSLGAAGAVVATAAGLLASDALGHDAPGHDLVHVHRDLMLGATALAMSVLVVAWWKGAAGRAWRVGLAVAAAVLVVVMTLGADRGAFLVYEHGVGVANQPGREAHHSH